MTVDVLSVVQPVLDYVDGNGVSYYVDMDSVLSSATSEEGYGDWPGADYLLSSGLYALLHFHCCLLLPSLAFNIIWISRNSYICLLLHGKRWTVVNYE